MAQSLGDAVVDVRADTSQFGRDLNQGVTKSTQDATKQMGGLEKSVKGVGLAAKLFIAGQAAKALGSVVGFAKDSIASYTDLNESINATNVVFGENAEAVQRLGENAARNLGLSNAEFNTLSVAAGAFTDKIAESLGQEVPEVLDTLTTRVADFASVMNIDVDEAFTKFRSGLAGESEPLRQFGIDVSAATVEQTALAEGIITTGEAMTEADKVTARYLTIMEQTEKTAGDFANTSDEAANKQRILTAELENQRAELGEQLMPLQMAWLAIQKDAIPILGDIALELGKMTGALNEAEKRMAAFSGESGEAVVTADAFLTSIKEFEASGFERAMSRTLGLGEWREWNEILKEGIATSGLTSEELDVLAGRLEALTDAGQLTEDQLAELLVEIEAVKDAEFGKAMADDADRVLILKDAQVDLTKETEGLGDANADAESNIDAATDAMKAQHDQIRGNLDPMFNLSQRSEAVADAQADITAAIEEYGEESPEHIAAVEDLAEANLDLKIAEDEARVAVDLTRDAFIEQQIELGLTREQAELLADQFEDLERFTFTPKVIDVRVNSRGVNVDQGTVGLRQHGGPVAAGSPYIVGEAGPELFVPKVNGQVISNNTISNVGGGSVEIINNFHGVTDEATARRLSAAAAEGAIEVLSRKRVVQ